MFTVLVFCVGFLHKNYTRDKNLVLDRNTDRNRLQRRRFTLTDYIHTVQSFRKGFPSPEPRNESLLTSAAHLEGVRGQAAGEGKTGRAGLGLARLTRGWIAAWMTLISLGDASQRRARMGPGQLPEISTSKQQNRKWTSKELQTSRERFAGTWDATVERGTRTDITLLTGLEGWSPDCNLCILS